LRKEIRGFAQYLGSLLLRSIRWRWVDPRNHFWGHAWSTC